MRTIHYNNNRSWERKYRRKLKYHAFWRGRMYTRVYENIFEVARDARMFITHDCKKYKCYE